MAPPSSTPAPSSPVDFDIFDTAPTQPTFDEEACQSESECATVEAAASISQPVEPHPDAESEFPGERADDDEIQSVEFADEHFVFPTQPHSYAEQYFYSDQQTEIGRSNLEIAILLEQGPSQESIMTPSRDSTLASGPTLEFPSASPTIRHDQEQMERVLTQRRTRNIRRPRRRRGSNELYQPWKSSRLPSPPKRLIEKSPLLVVQRSTTLHLLEEARAVLKHLHTPLAPLIDVTTGQVHPSFPRSVLQYDLLTHEQLDSLAKWYHQTHDGGIERWQYPVPMDKVWTFRNMSTELSPEERDRLEIDIDLATKRRRFARFIGFRACDEESTHNNDLPVDFAAFFDFASFYDEEEDDDTSAHHAQIGDMNMNMNMNEQDESSPQSIVEQMDRDWRAALERARDEERMQEKLWKDL